jgi:hypothetical protein
MELTQLDTNHDLRSLVEQQADFIVRTQLPSGAIPWYRGAMVDPWDHIEAAIALNLAGRHEEAARAYEWARGVQNTDGSWYSSYLGNEPQALARDTSFSSYIATGMWLNYQATGDQPFLEHMWPMIEKGLDFALGVQHPSGEVPWAAGPKGEVWPSAILTSNCCIWKSIRNGIEVARALGHEKPAWEKASDSLLYTIRHKPELFDRLDENKRRYAMNWFYPVLTGVVDGYEARERIDREWNDFVIDGWGCRVAADEDVTAVAETSELMIALALVGEHERGNRLLNWTLRLQDDKGGFCRGVKLPEEEPCPPDTERASWTSAALIMAIAALSKP